MIDIYKQFIKTKLVKKDINFFFGVIKELVMNDLYPKYLISRRLNKSYKIVNYLCGFNETCLCFYEDILNINFSVDNNQKSYIQIVEMSYDNFKMKIALDINIFLKTDERKNRLIYADNKFLHSLQKTIYLIKEEHKKRIFEDEILYDEILQDNLKNIKKSENLNDIIYIIKKSTDPFFRENLSKLDPIISGIKTKTLDIIFFIIHRMRYYKNYKKHIKPARIEKILFTDEEAVEIAGILNHQLTEEKNKFLEDVVEHYNQRMFKSSMEIDGHITKTFHKIKEKN